MDLDSQPFERKVKIYYIQNRQLCKESILLNIKERVKKNVSDTWITEQYDKNKENEAKRFIRSDLKLQWLVNRRRRTS